MHIFIISFVMAYAFSNPITAYADGRDSELIKTQTKINGYSTYFFEEDPGVLWTAPLINHEADIESQYDFNHYQSLDINNGCFALNPIHKRQPILEQILMGQTPEQGCYPPFKSDFDRISFNSKLSQVVFNGIQTTMVSDFRHDFWTSSFYDSTSTLAYAYDGLLGGELKAEDRDLYKQVICRCVGDDWNEDRENFRLPLNNRILVIIDIQPEFEESISINLIQNIQKKIIEAMRENRFILFLEYEDSGSTLPQLTELVAYYDKVAFITKADDDGSDEILQYLEEAHFFPAYFPYSLEIAGVNSDKCVKDTVLGISQVINDQWHDQTKIVVHERSCATDEDQFWHFDAIKSMSQLPHVYIEWRN